MTSEDPARPTSTDIDARNRHLAQEAGLDQDLESQVPARYGGFTETTLGIMLVVLIAVAIWIIL